MDKTKTLAFLLSLELLFSYAQNSKLEIPNQIPKKYDLEEVLEENEIKKKLNKIK